MDVPCFGPGLPRPRLLRTRVRVQPLINMGTIGTGHADLSRSTRQCISVSWWCDLRPRILSVGGSSVPTDVIGPKQASADTATEIAIKWTNLCGFNGSKIVLALPCETVANLEGVGGRGSGVGGRGLQPPPVQPWTNVMILLEWVINRWTARQEGISDRSIPRCGVHCTMTLHSVPDPGGRGFNPQVLLLIWKLKILTKEFFKNSQIRPCEGPVKDLWEPTIIDGIIPPLAVMFVWSVVMSKRNRNISSGDTSRNQNRSPEIVNSLTYPPTECSRSCGALWEAEVKYEWWLSAHICQGWTRSLNNYIVFKLYFSGLGQHTPTTQCNCKCELTMIHYDWDLVWGTRMANM